MIKMLVTANTAAKLQQAAQFYPTPRDVIDDMVRIAGLHERGARGWTVLEPSAGTGAIAEWVAPVVAAVDCVEIDTDAAAHLRAGGYARAVTAADFLTVPPGALYDRVIMNPPFTRGAAVAHVTHALQFVKPSGLLVAVMPEGVTWRSGKAWEAFRTLFEERRGWYSEVDPDAFKASGAGARTVIVAIPGSEAARSRPALPFRVLVNGSRVFRIKPYPEAFTSCDDWWTPVDCQDVSTGMESQSIVLTAAVTDPAELIKDGQTRDAIRSAYCSATTPRGEVTGGEHLPELFTIEPYDPDRPELATSAEPVKVAA